MAICHAVVHLYYRKHVSVCPGSTAALRLGAMHDVLTSKHRRDRGFGESMGVAILIDKTMDFLYVNL